VTPARAGFSWAAIGQGLPYLLEGAGLTILISAVAMVLAAALGLALAGLCQAPGRLARRLVGATEGLRALLYALWRNRGVRLRSSRRSVLALG